MRIASPVVALIAPLLGWCVPTAMAADGDIVRAQLERYFHPAAAVAELPAGDAAALVDWLVVTGRDRWARIGPGEVAVEVGRRAISDGYGLRVLDREDGLFLAPQPGSPNAAEGHRLLEVIEVPVEESLRTALEAGTLALAEDGEALSEPLVRGDFVLPPFVLDGPVLRLDDFVGAGLDRALARAAEPLADVTVLDLRFNGGGRIGSAVRLLDVLLGDGVPFGRIERRGRSEPLGPSVRAADAMRGERAAGLTVLISRHTASAAEWVARVLQLEGARLVGERSEGKCLVHDAFPAGDGETIEFSVGRLAVHGHELAYDHCDFGLLPDAVVDGRTLIETSAWELEHTRFTVRREAPPTEENVSD